MVTKLDLQAAQQRCSELSVLLENTQAREADYKARLAEKVSELAAAQEQIAALTAKVAKLECIERPDAKIITKYEREPADIATIQRLEQELAECRSDQAIE